MSCGMLCAAVVLCFACRLEEPTSTHSHCHNPVLTTSSLVLPLAVSAAAATTHLLPSPPHTQQLATIAEMAAPVTWQTMAQPPKGRPDIQPTLLAGPPKTAEEEAAELAAQQQEQQNGGADGDDDDDLPALI